MVKMYSESLEIGWEAPDFKLKSIDEEMYSIEDFLDKKGLLVVFTCNHCPYARATWPVLQELYDEYGDSIEFVAINSNDADQYPDDSYSAMKEYAEKIGLDFEYLHDEDQSVAKTYKAQCTPDPYLFKVEEGTPKLFYHGRINDNWQNPDLVERRDMKEAIELLINDNEPPKEQVPSMGCSIKWKE